MKNNVLWQIITYYLIAYCSMLIPTYWYYYGPCNFLWLSDIGLLLTTLGLIINSRLYVSIAAVMTLLIELIWNIDFLTTLFFNNNLLQLANYMLDRHYPLLLRLLSLFHVFMPVIWISYLVSYGYDTRALPYSIFFYWLIIIMTYITTEPKQNINWAFMSLTIPPILWIILLCIVFPLFIILPTHILFKKFF